MAAKSATKAKSNGKVEPYFRRVTPLEFAYSEEAEVRVFDDRDVTGCIHVQFCTQSERGRRVAVFHVTKDEFQEVVEDLKSAVKALP